MMQVFDPVAVDRIRRNPAGWLKANASGNCSILMRTSAGTAVYTFWHDNPAGPMIYGPIGYRDEAGKTRITYRRLPEVNS